MPEVVSKEIKNFSRDLKGEVGDRLFLFTKDVRRLVDANGLKHIGDGAECAVVAMKNGEFRKVTAIRYHEIEPREAITTYYLQRIFSTLFPHNFPHFYASFSNDKKDLLPVTVRHRVDVVEGGTIRYPLEKVFRTLKSSDAISYIFLDTLVGNNCGIGPDGGEYYLDITRISDRHWKKENLLNCMKNKNQDGEKYTDKDIRTVSTSIDRLASLGAIELEK
jgi:hypothetical protein